MVMNSHVTLSQPMSRLYGASWEMHTSTEYPGGDGISGLLPGDANWVGQQAGSSAVVFEVGNLPPESTLRIVTANANSSPCSQAGTNGNRISVDIWVRPKIGGVLRSEKYLGYSIYQHVDEVTLGTQYLTASAFGYAITTVAKVWDSGTPPISYGGKLCWSGPHVHQVASRDPSLESSWGTYATGVSATYSGGSYVSPLGAGSEIYRWTVDWDK